MSHSAGNRYFKVAADVLDAWRLKLGRRTLEEQSFTESQMNLLQQFYEKLSADYNATIIDEPLQVTVRGMVLAAAGGQPIPQMRGRTLPLRLVVSTSFWALSIRAQPAIIEFFILPATELPTLARSELPSRAKLCLRLAETRSGAWTLNEAVVSPEELHILLRGLFKDITTRSKTDYENMPHTLKLIASGQSFAGSVRSLLAEKHALVQKIVDQQEVIQSQLARELHDSVLGNVMLLKRSLSSAKRMADEEMVTVLQDIADHLRDVCQELYPRDLKDCGLRPMVEELCRNFSDRADWDCELICPDTIPDFSQEVALHIYRIAQECLTNAAKHSQATDVLVEIKVADGLFTMTIADNGVGFDVIQSQHVKSARDGGTGAGIIRERAELIGCIYPAKVWFESHSGKGTKLTLEILVSAPKQGELADPNQ